MIIGVDGNEANIKNRVGINAYAFELLWGLWRLQGESKSRHSLIVYLKNNPLPDLPKETQNFKYKVIPGGGLWIMTRLVPDLFISGSRPDVFFSPSHYVPPMAPMPRACSIMDLGYLEFSGQFKKIEFWQLKVWSAISINISKAVFAISNSTKNDIVRHYPTSAGKLYVTQLAYDKSKFNNNISPDDVRRVKDKYSIAYDYVLYLGTLKPSKNIETLISAFAVLKKVPGLSAKLKLVIAGKKGWLFRSIFEKVAELGLESDVIFTDFVAEEDKPAIIKGAKVFVLPSFWEGFGLDALNSMASGVPVIVSNVGSLPEVVGEAGIKINPKSTESISEAIRKVLLMSEKEYNSLVDKGLAQAKKFSWDDTARKTLSVLEGIKK